MTGTTVALLALVAILGEAARRMRDAQREALEAAAKLIEATAKAELGEYQDAAGQFAAWPLAAAPTRRVECLTPHAPIRCRS